MFLKCECMMKKTHILNVFFILFILGCKSNAGERETARLEIEKAGTTHKDEVEKLNSRYDEFGNRQIFSDSIFKNKKYKILISSFSDEKSYDEGDYNSVFQLFELDTAGTKKIYQDSIQRHFDEVLFEDFTNDGVPDILIQNISDVRSNVTYYLYKIDTTAGTVTKIKDFETIKNPHFLPQYNLIDNMVMSGRNWTAFYEIIDDKVKDYGFSIKDGEEENGRYSYDSDYKKALRKILKLRKKKVK